MRRLFAAATIAAALTITSPPDTARAAVQTNDDAYAGVCHYRSAIFSTSGYPTVRIDSVNGHCKAAGGYSFDAMYFVGGASTHLTRQVFAPFPGGTSRTLYWYGTFGKAVSYVEVHIEDERGVVYTRILGGTTGSAAQGAT